MKILREFHHHLAWFEAWNDEDSKFGDQEILCMVENPVEIKYK